MELEKCDFKRQKILKMLTIASYVLSILLYEIGICNGQLINKVEFSYNFSLCRIVLYAIFLVLLIKNIDKFIPNALETIKLKSKKFLIGAYTIVSIIAIIYIMIKWSSTYKIITLMITLLMGMLFLIYVSVDYIKNVIILTFTLGIIFTFTTDFHHVIDEKKHMASAINIAEGNFDYVENPLNEPVYNNIIFNCDLDQFAKFFSEKFIPNSTNEWNITEELQIYYVCSSPADYKPLLYLPSVLGITFARVLGGSIADVYILGRLFNLIAYSAMLILILKLLPYKKKIFYIIYTLPFILLLAASYSVDGICIGILGTFIAYCLNLSERDYKDIKLKQILILMALYLLCLVAKNFSYCAIILFIFILPVFKILKNNKKQLPIIITIIIVAIIACGILMLDKLQSTTDAGGDPRGGETSVTGQIEFLLDSPMNIVKVGFEHIMNSVLNYNWYIYLNHGSFFGKYHAQIFFLQLIFIMYVCLTDNSKNIKLRVKINSIITFIVVFASTSLMLYLTFTPVGQTNISGYQPRYIIPILPMVLMLINNKRYIGKSTEYETKETDIKINLVSGLILIIDLICLTIVV